MGKLADTYAGALLQFVQENGRLEPMFRQVSSYLNRPLRPQQEKFDGSQVNEDLMDFIEYVESKGRQEFLPEILERFLELARGSLGILGVEVVSAVPLTPEQLTELQIRLIKRAKRQVQLLPRVDPSLIAGLRIAVDGMVMDTSVKQQLADLRDKIYRGVYFAQ